MIRFPRISLQVTKKCVFYEISQCKKQWIDKDEFLQGFVEEKLCCVYDEITSGIIHFKFLNYWHSIQTYTVNRWNVCTWSLQRKHSSQESIEKCCASAWLCKVIFGKNHTGKNIGFRLIYSSPSTQFIRPCIKWFSSFLFSTKCFQEEEMETFVENLSRSKSAKFYLRGINKQLDK